MLRDSRRGPDLRARDRDRAADRSRAAACRRSSLGGYAWVVLTSANGVRAVFDALDEAKLDARAFGAAKVLAIGPLRPMRSGSAGSRPTSCPPSIAARPQRPR